MRAGPCLEPYDADLPVAVYRSGVGSSRQSLIGSPLQPVAPQTSDRPLHGDRIPPGASTYLCHPVEPPPYRGMKTFVGTWPPMSLQRQSGSSESAEHDSIELMSRAARGDTDAFDRIIEQFWAPTFLYAASLTKDTDRAADLAQDAFARLWNARERIISPGAVRAYLLRSVHNLFVSERRRWKVRMRWLVATPVETERSPRTPLQDVEAAELHEAMREAIDGLAPRRRQAFTLFHVENLSYREIAELMEIRPQSVANLLQAAMRDLRCALRGFLPSDPTADRGH